MASLNSHTQTIYTELDDVTAKDFFLKNRDLMAKTFSHLQVNDKKNRQCLLNAALTCKNFLNVALDALWEELDSLVPLLKLLPALQLENKAYILSGNVSQVDRDRLRYYSQKVKVFSASAIDTDDNPQPEVHPSTYIRIAQLQSSALRLFPSLRHLHYNLDDRSISHIFLFLSPLLDSLELFHIGDFENTQTIVGPFLAALSSQMIRRIVLKFGQMSVDILKSSIVHFKQLRSLELIDAVFMSDFVLWDVLGALPSLANLTLSIDHTCHPAHDPENSNAQSASGRPKRFYALENICITKGSFFLIQYLLGSIDSSYLKSIVVYPVNDLIRNGPEPEDLFTPFMTIVVSKWSQSLKNLVIGPCSTDIAHRNLTSKCLMLFTGLHEMQTFMLVGWRMENVENIDDDVSRLVMSWPKLKILQLPLNQAFISLSTLRIIAENCPELHHLQIQVRLDTSTIPPFDTSSESLRHNLEILTVGRAHPSDSITQTILEYQIRATQYLDFIFPYLKSIEVQHMDEVWSAIRDLAKLCRDARRIK